MQAIWIMIACAFLCGASTAWAKDPNPMQVKETQKLEQVGLGIHLSILEDGTHALTLQDIKSGTHDASFKPTEKEFPGLDNPTGAFWAKFSINYDGEGPRQVLIENRYPLLDEMTVFKVHADGQVSSLRLGDEVPYENRPIGFRYPVFPVTLEPGINPFYLHFSNKGTFVVSLHLWDIAEFQTYAKYDNVILGFLYGCLVVLLLYNTFLMVSIRSKTYGLYVLYLLVFIASQFGIQATGIEWIGGDLGHWLMNRGWLPLVSLSHVFSCLFAIRFLNMSAYMPRWKRVLEVLAVINVGVAIHGLFGPYHTVGKELTYTTVLVSVALIGAGIHSIRKGFRPAVFYTLAWSCLLLGNLAMTLMFNGMLPLSPLVQWSSFIGGALEVSLMSLALGARVTDLRKRSENKIRDLNHILTKHLEEVEAVVAERTATIRSIIDHVKSGFFTVNRQLQIEAGFTKSCHSLLGENMQAEVQVADVLELEGSRRSMFQMAIRQVFEDNLTEVAALSQIPKTFRIGHAVLSLEGSLIRDGAGRPKTILFTVNDMTKLRLKQREALKSSMLIKILRNMSSFTSFLAVTRDKIKLLRTEELRANHKMVAFMLHTMKGNCSIFNMKAQADLIHQLEERDELSFDDIQKLEASFQSFLNSHHDVLGISWSDDFDKTFLVRQSALAELRRDLEILTVEPKMVEYFDRWCRKITAPSVRSLLGPIGEDAQQLAKKLGRKIQFELKGEEVRILNEEETNLVRSLIHLVRNAILHGIEEQRDTLHKNPRGQIVLGFEERGDSLCIRCRDDGRGIDRHEISKAVVTRGLAKEESLPGTSTSELFRLLCQEGFSTSHTIDLYSGRGVGVGAVYEAVHACRGEIEIITEVGQGTEFVITIPRVSAVEVSPIAS